MVTRGDALHSFHTESSFRKNSREKCGRNGAIRHTLFFCSHNKQSQQPALRVGERCACAAAHESQCSADSDLVSCCLELAGAAWSKAPLHARRQEQNLCFDSRQKPERLPSRLLPSTPRALRAQTGPGAEVNKFLHASECKNAREKCRAEE